MNEHYKQLEIAVKRQLATGGMAPAVPERVGATGKAAERFAEASSHITEFDTAASRKQSEPTRIASPEDNPLPAAGPAIQPHTDWTKPGPNVLFKAEVGPTMDLASALRHATERGLCAYHPLVGFIVMAEVVCASVKAEVPGATARAVMPMRLLTSPLNGALSLVPIDVWSLSTSSKSADWSVGQALLTSGEGRTTAQVLREIGEEPLASAIFLGSGGILPGGQPLAPTAAAEPSIPVGAFNALVDEMTAMIGRLSTIQGALILLANGGEVKP